MHYKAISADGHVNEPPNLWVENLPPSMRERGPHVIETPKTKGHAWIMEGQTRPSPMGFNSMYFRSAKRFDRASLVESFKQIKDRGVRYEDVFPGSYDPAARVEEITEDKTDADGHERIDRAEADRVGERLPVDAENGDGHAR